MTLVAAFMCGLVFGLGLVISGMTQPTKVLGFLDVFGTWDPTLAIVMAAALAVSFPGFVFAGRRGRSILAQAADLPTKSAIDGPLVIGAVLFGAGWGLVGLCPGPALANLATFSPAVVVFVLAMSAGILLKDYGPRLLARREPASADG